MNKLCSTARKLDTACRILFWIMIVCGIIATAAVILSFVMYAMGAEGESFILSIDLDFINLQLAEDVVPPREMAKVQHTISLTAMIMLIAGMAMGAYCVKLIRSILSPMTQGMPFHEAVSVNLKKLAWVELIGGAIISCTELVMNHLLIYGFNLTELLLNDKINQVTFNYSFDFTFILYAAALFLLSYIFRYGTQLQQLSDETL